MPFSFSPCSLSPCSGLFTALITPFQSPDTRLDEEGFLHLLDRQIKAQVAGVVLMGSTGEGISLTHTEEKRLLTLAVSHVKGAFPLITSIHASSTQAACEQAKKAEGLGANGLLALVPPYNRPTQEGLYQHFSKLLQASNLPVIIYNVPHRTGSHLELDTFKRLIDIPTCVALKECSGGLSYVASCIQYARKQRPDFSVMSGDDAYTLPLMALGAKGLISVASNLFPKVLKRLVALCLNEDLSAARLLHDQLLPLFGALFLETNPIPIKEAAQFLKLPSGGCRLPLTAMTAKYQEQLHAILKDPKLQGIEDV